jgi:hypothetical protein
MAQWQSQDTIGADLYAVDTTQEFTLGTIVTAEDKDTDSDLGAAEFMYVQGVASAEAASVVTIDQADYTTSLATANDVGIQGVCVAALVADTYGWVQISGKAECKVATGFAAGTVAYLTSTAGTIDDAVVSGDLIYGSIGLTAIDTPNTGTAYVGLSRPFTTNT